MAKLIHLGCGHVLGNFISDEDHGSFEIECPGCNTWVQVFNGLLNNPPGDGIGGSIIYRNDTAARPSNIIVDDTGDCSDPECPHNEAPSGD